MADALCRKAHCLSITRVKVIGFDILPDLYASDPYFSTIYDTAQAKKSAQYTVHEGFLFRASQLCIPDCSIRELVIKEIEVHLGR